MVDPHEEEEEMSTVHHAFLITKILLCVTKDFFIDLHISSNSEKDRAHQSLVDDGQREGGGSPIGRGRITHVDVSLFKSFGKYLKDIVLRGHLQDSKVRGGFHTEAVPRYVSK